MFIFTIFFHGVNICSHREVGLSPSKYKIELYKINHNPEVRLEVMDFQFACDRKAPIKIGKTWFAVSVPNYNLLVINTLMDGWIFWHLL